MCLTFSITFVNISHSKQNYVRWWKHFGLAHIWRDVLVEADKCDTHKFQTWPSSLV